MDYEEDQLIEQTRLCQLEELASDRYKLFQDIYLVCGLSIDRVGSY